MKIILVNILLVSAVLGFSVEKNQTDFSPKTRTVETVSNITDVLNRDNSSSVSFEEAESVLSGLNFEYLRIYYNEPKIENYKSSYLQENRPNASCEAQHTLKI